MKSLERFNKIRKIFVFCYESKNIRKIENQGKKMVRKNFLEKMECFMPTSKSHSVVVFSFRKKSLQNARYLQIRSTLEQILTYHGLATTDTAKPKRSRDSESTNNEIYPRQTKILPLPSGNISNKLLYPFKICYTK